MSHNILNHKKKHVRPLQVLGPNTCFGGFRTGLSSKWKSVIITHLSIEANITKLVRTSPAWASGLIVAISWQGVLILWDLQNRSFHGPNQFVQSEAEKWWLLNEAACWLLEISNGHQGFQIEWFQKPLEELEKYSVVSLKAWVCNAPTMVRLHHLELQTKLWRRMMRKGTNVNSIDLLPG